MEAQEFRFPGHVFENLEEPKAGTKYFEEFTRVHAKEFEATFNGGLRSLLQKSNDLVHCVTRRKRRPFDSIDFSDVD